MTYQAITSTKKHVMSVSSSNHHCRLFGLLHFFGNRFDSEQDVTILPRYYGMNYSGVNIDLCVTTVGNRMGNLFSVTELRSSRLRCFRHILTHCNILLFKVSIEVIPGRFFRAGFWSNINFLIGAYMELSQVRNFKRVLGVILVLGSVGSCKDTYIEIHHRLFRVLRGLFARRHILHFIIPFSPYNYIIWVPAFVLV